MFGLVLFVAQVPIAHPIEVNVAHVRPREFTHHLTVALNPPLEVVSTLFLSNGVLGLDAVCLVIKVTGTAEGVD